MTSSPHSRPRRRFAAKRRSRGWGIGLGAFGAFTLLGGVMLVVTGNVGDAILNLLVGAGLILFGLYLLRGSDAPAPGDDRAEDSGGAGDVGAPGDAAPGA